MAWGSVPPPVGGGIDRWLRDQMTIAGKTPELALVVADDEMANTDLMRQLRDSDTYTVAQFAQAIGAVHYANYRRNRAADERQRERPAVARVES